MMNEKSQSIDVVVASIVESIYDSVDSFDRAAKALLDKAEDPDAAAVGEYIDVLRTNITGNLHWS